MIIWQSEDRVIYGRESLPYNMFHIITEPTILNL